MITAQWVTEKGTAIRIGDSAYREKTEEEIEAIRRNITETVRRCLQEDARERTRLVSSNPHA